MEYKSLIAVLLIVSSAYTLTACASASKDVSEVYVSPLQYNSYDCDQLAAEEQRLRVRMTQLGARLDTSAKNDKWLAGAAVFTYGISLAFVGGNKEQEAEFSRLKGEYNAVQQSAIARKCITPIPAATAPVTTSTGTVRGGESELQVDKPQ